MDIAAYIEHTLLRADARIEQVHALCQEAIEHNLFGVCVPPYYVKSASQILHVESPKVVTVIGFPLGYSTTPSKVEEARKALDEGADELDMVINIAALKSADWNYVKNDIQSVCTLTQMRNKKLKVIIETALLSQEEKQKSCAFCAETGVDFVKTSTGFAASGATVEDVLFMRTVLPDNIGIKASGGIKTARQAKALIEAGATRIGTSSGVSIVQKTIMS